MCQGRVRRYSAPMSRVSQPASQPPKAGRMHREHGCPTPKRQFMAKRRDKYRLGRTAYENTHCWLSVHRPTNKPVTFDLRKASNAFLAEKAIMWGTDYELGVGDEGLWRERILAAWEKWGTGKPLDPNTVERLAFQFAK